MESEIDFTGKRLGFAEIVAGWTLVRDLDALTDRIERAAEWTRDNGPLLPAEENTIKMMIEVQIANGLEGGFAV